MEEEEEKKVQLKKNDVVTLFNKEIHLKPNQKVGIGSFDVLQLLGKGSFGNVYRVKLKYNGKIYALKQ